MKIDKINNLLELFYQQYEKQNKEDVFLQSLKDIEKKYSWRDVYENIMKLSEEISKYINKGDRCLLISENRPEWMIADLSIMLSRGTTVPAYTTYVERDYEYIIDDCTPTIIIVSDKIQYEKVKNIIPKKDFIKKTIVFEKIKDFEDNFILNTGNIFKKENYNKKNLMYLQILRK